MKNIYHHRVVFHDYAVLLIQGGSSKIYKMDVDWDDHYGKDIHYVVLFDEFEPESGGSPLDVKEDEIRLLSLNYMPDDSIVPVELLTWKRTDLSELTSREKISDIAEEMFDELRLNCRPYTEGLILIK